MKQNTLELAKFFNVSWLNWKEMEGTKGGRDGASWKKQPLITPNSPLPLRTPMNPTHLSIQY